ncbi:MULTISPECIES: hypothetical protein [Pantoea]|jgi:hypothetical protein|uniref:CopG family transcriptional regulator n=1 Tax=Pantoea brenneri TaxID=472694 RepID=A0A7Y6TTN7_9GAMM|nr:MULTISPECIES: hypothetical protein [Pantoea]MBZ6396997.1 hypothetical protein [Pantoea sp.]MBZ6440252.1 hypothetical protein [Pantoea sp.]NUY43484.1 hypothetical protein [Pantoea brenneri]NUY50950.1 hypothetical protein [Pantoea brenneri]NUY61319.1 hypothetical protein [Pantoea brenneri]
MLNKPKREITEAAADALARRLADRNYGEERPDDTVARTTISLPRSLLVQLEDLAMKNKRNGIEPKSVSAIVREATEAYLRK